MSHKEFIFSSYQFNAASKTLNLHYAIDEAYAFTETYKFDFEFVDYDTDALDRAVQLLFYTAGVSYYKTFLPERIVSKAGEIDAQLAAYLRRTYQNGLGEFFYVNGLDPNTQVVFPSESPEPKPHTVSHNGGLIIGIGGGKDSLVSVELLRDADFPIATWSLNHRAQLEPLIERIGTRHLWVERTWDKQLADLNQNGAYNGHVPISAIFAAVGTVVGILSGYRDHVVSNEQSANEPTLEYQGLQINHQYSKSQMFERDYQALLVANFSDTQRYYSLLRPLTELRIGELFASIGFDKYHDVFSSCNRAYVHGQTGLSWDGTCPKCAFVYLILAPFIPEEKLLALFGHNLLLDKSLEPTYRQLLGIEGDKPLECVGEIEESRAAMRMLQDAYPALQQYEFELHGEYDFRRLATHEIPAEVFAVIESEL